MPGVTNGHQNQMKTKMQLTRKQFDTILNAISIGIVTTSQDENKKYHPEWAADVDAARNVLIYETNIAEEN